MTNRDLMHALAKMAEEAGFSTAPYTKVGGHFEPILDDDAPATAIEKYDVWMSIMGYEDEPHQGGLVAMVIASDSLRIYPSLEIDGYGIPGFSANHDILIEYDKAAKANPEQFMKQVNDWLLCISEKAHALRLFHEKMKIIHEAACFPSETVSRSTIVW